MTKNQTYGEALNALKEGKRVLRKGWSGCGMFVFMQVPSEIPEHIVPNMQSLPQSVKDEFVARGGSLSYSSQFAMVDDRNNIRGWVASVADSLAEDWVILD